MEIDFAKIKELRGEIHKLLEKRPEYIPLQQEIDRQLKKCGDPLKCLNLSERNQIRRNRCAVIQNMMLQKWMEMMPALEKLSISIGKIVPKR